MIMMIYDLSCYNVSCPLHQTPVNSRWTQTQPTKSCYCQNTILRWRWVKRRRRILIIQTDSTTGNSCCAQRGWQVAVTGRLSGRGRFISLWRTEESGGEEKATTAASEKTTSPGVWAALTEVTPFCTTTRAHPSINQAPKEWACTWTGLRGLCLSTVSHQTDGSHTFTPSAPVSQRRSILLSGSGLTRLTHQSLCVTYTKTYISIFNLLTFH